MFNSCPWEAIEQQQGIAMAPLIALMEPTPLRHACAPPVARRLRVRDHAEETLKAMIALARYAELFAFDENANIFSLGNPE